LEIGREVGVVVVVMMRVVMEGFSLQRTEITRCDSQNVNYDD